MMRRPSSSTCAEAFGAERLLWGSDYPQTHDRSYAALVELGRAACAGLPRRRSGAVPRRERTAALALTHDLTGAPSASPNIATIRR